MDDADRATDQIERELADAIAAARGIAPRWRSHCDQCGEPLAEHRRERGRCMECQERLELRLRTMAAGV